MSKYRLPSSQHLIAFESAARLGSFSLAADELCLSPPAITNKVKQIESYLGQKLFVRLPKGVMLTEIGRGLYYDIERSLNHLQDNINKYKNSNIYQSITIYTTPAFANRWLVKRLKYFWADYPEIELKIHHTLENIPLLSYQNNMAVRWGDGDWSGLISEPLFSGEKYPIISPDLAKKVNLRTPVDLYKVTLLHEDNHNDWKQWLGLVGIELNNTRLGPIIDDAEALLSLTIDGQGIALGRTAMLEEEIRAKRLICPFDTFLPSQKGYWLVYPPSLRENNEAMYFRRFLLEQKEKAYH